MEINALDKRKFKRVKVDDPVQFQFQEFGLREGCLAKDISEGGVRINLNHFVPIETKMILQIALSADRIVDCTGHVVWVKQIPYSERYQAGLMFDETDSIHEARNRLHRFIAP